jgi:DNA topoisomerase IA
VQSVSVRLIVERKIFRNFNAASYSIVAEFESGKGHLRQSSKKFHQKKKEAEDF